MQIMEHMQHVYEEGRPEAAPTLAKKTNEIQNVNSDSCEKAAMVERCFKCHCVSTFPANGLT